MLLSQRESNMFTLQALFLLSANNANESILDSKLSDIATLNTNCTTLRDCFNSNMSLFNHYGKDRFCDNVDSAIEMICEQLHIDIDHPFIVTQSLDELRDTDE